MTRRKTVRGDAGVFDELHVVAGNVARSLDERGVWCDFTGEARGEPPRTYLWAKLTWPMVRYKPMGVGRRCFGRLLESADLRQRWCVLLACLEPQMHELAFQDLLRDKL